MSSVLVQREALSGRELVKPRVWFSACTKEDAKAVKASSHP